MPKIVSAHHETVPSLFKNNSKPYINDNCSHCKNQWSQGKVASPQLDLFASSSLVVSLEPLRGRFDRVRLTVKQLDCTWELVPSLTRREGKALLDALAEAGIAFDLDLNEGWPVEVEQIHWATEQLIAGGAA